MNPPDGHIHPDSMIVKAIKQAIDTKTQEIAEEEIAKASKAIERRVREMIGQIATNVYSHVNYSMRGANELIITVRIPENNSPPYHQ